MGALKKYTILYIFGEKKLEGGLADFLFELLEIALPAYRYIKKNIYITITGWGYEPLKKWYAG